MYPLLLLKPTCSYFVERAPGIADTQADLLIMTVNTLYRLRVEAGLKSMLTDINQFNNPDKRLESRTDDLNAVLRLGR